MEETFTDGAEREIVISADPDYGVVTACYENVEIGRFSYDVMESIDSYNQEYSVYDLAFADIDTEFQRSGIGTEMIRFGEEVFEFVTYPKMGNTTDQNHLSSEGAALLQSCIAKGIIKAELWG